MKALLGIIVVMLLVWVLMLWGIERAGDIHEEPSTGEYDVEVIS